ncbi:hypothetical protein ACIP8U_00435 [Streptomyces pseudovenezuelae]|uniref:hypothetical protein n=1 Tax=Streptomyces pseudovenezuelae TaxID=67350 RepID=UPI00380CF5F7
MAVRRQYSRGEWISSGVFMLVILVAFASCSPGGSGESANTDDGNAGLAHVTGPRAAGGGGLSVTAARFSEWPFTVDAGLLKCEAGAVTFEPAGGPRYAVNGTAKDVGYPDISPIWAEDEDLGYGLKVDISEVLNKGLSLC